MSINKYLNENYPHYVVEYRGNFEEQLNNIYYAWGVTITDTLAIIAVKYEDINRLRTDVPSIIFIEARSIYILQDINPSNIDSIQKIKINPYLNLNGKGVLVGMIDSGINYINQEFIREDDTSRVLKIWDQTIQEDTVSEVKFGTVYNENEINEAIKLYKNGGDPYTIVPSKDEINHGTKMAGIIGARGYNGKMKGIATHCDFLIVKLLESPNYKKILRENNLKQVPVYENSEILAAIEFLIKTAKELDRPLIIYLGVGSHDGSHDGYNITTRFISNMANKGGIIFVAGTGNSGAEEGHVSNYIKNVGEIHTIELKISKDIKKMQFYIWIQKPDKMKLNVIDPSGEEMGFFEDELYTIEKKDFYLINTHLEVTCYNPENFTGHQLFLLNFTNIRAGIWKLQLKGEYISNGRYDIWLPPSILLPKGTKFLTPSTYNTLTIPSTARKVISVGYYNSIKNSLLSVCGKGFNANQLIKPDIVADGISILTTSGDDNKIVSSSGSSVAAAIVTGAICLLAQWHYIKNIGIYSTKLRSELIYSAKRENGYNYPNEDIGYGKLNLVEVFNVLGGGYSRNNKYVEYYVNNLFIRYPLD